MATIPKNMIDQYWPDSSMTYSTGCQTVSGTTDNSVFDWAIGDNGTGDWNAIPQFYHKTFIQKAENKLQKIFIAKMKQLNYQAKLDHINDQVDFEKREFDTLSDSFKTDLKRLLNGVTYLDIGETDYTGVIKLKDGSLIEIDKDGNFQIDDSNAHVLYKANRNRDFNRYLNASDLMEEFIKDMAKYKIKQSEFLNIPVELFINWLILRAAEKDGDPVPDGVMNPGMHPKSNRHKIDYSPRCLTCGRFIPDSFEANNIKWCNEQHMLIFMQRRGLAANDGGRRRLPRPA